ncbi:unnamed protein product [Spirodela intermedia]|uniref:Uncharacterized protein n=1 Tax=Spirodela intermedia TaxID=51605 RepID=A0A7I8JY35_SPIIN|nr:unnamed protein product [Spirodela intermedia]
MDPASAPPPEHLCYVRCNYCNTVLAVGVPCRRLMETVTVKCGHCNNLSFLSTRPLVHSHCADLNMALGLGIQGSCNDHKRPSMSMGSSSAATQEPKAPYVVKPPERKHRVPSAYNRFMKEEIQRIKAAHPDIPHREAFSMASKNWAKNDPQSNNSKLVDERSRKVKMGTYQHVLQERPSGVMGEGFDAFKQLERRN